MSGHCLSGVSQDQGHGSTRLQTIVMHSTRLHGQRPERSATKFCNAVSQTVRVAYLPRQGVAHALIHGHEVGGCRGSGVQIWLCGQAQAHELAPQSSEARCKLRHIGAVQAVDAVRAQHAMLLPHRRLLWDQFTG